MRKFLLMAAALVIAICSCSQDEVLENVVSAPEGSFKAVIEKAPATRTYIDGEDGLTVKWKAGDLVSINDNLYKATSSGSTSTILIPFAGEAVPDMNGKFVAFYPYYLFYNSGIPTLQKFVDGTNASLPMMAVSDSKELSFKNMGAVLAVTITPTEELTKIKSIKVSSNKDMSGLLDFDDPSLPLLDYSDNTQPVTLEMEEAITLTGTTTFHIAVAAGTYQDLRITVSDGSNNYYNVTNSRADIVMERNKLYPVTFQSQGISNYLTLTALEDDSSVGISSGFNESIINLHYSTDSGDTWEQVTSDFSDITLAKGQSVLFKGENESTFSYIGRLQFTMSGRIKASGNIMTLLDGDNPGTEITGERTFDSLFEDCTALEDAKDLYLPATTLPSSSYSCMFYNCTSLKTAPALPATTLYSYCYYNMFYGCSALEVAPALPATTLAEGCYGYMFTGCKTLKAAPALPATTLAESCYDRMFQDCTALETAPALPATTLARTCYNYMFYNCTALKSAPELLPATTLAQQCYQGMFAFCTALKTAPALPATTLAGGCYRSMFQGCAALVTAPALPAIALADYCYDSMFYGCTALTSAPALPATTLALSCYGAMFYKCTALVTAPALPATTLANSCYSSMFNKCTALVTAPALPATTLAESCYSNMFYECNALKTAPELLAAILAKDCYKGMFASSKNLASVTMLATDVSESTGLEYFLYQAGENATNPVLYVNAAMTDNETIIAQKGNFTIKAKN